MSFNYNQFLMSGKNAEEKISLALKKLIASSRTEDINGVDLKLTFTFDVKTAKKIRRSDLSPSYTKTWIEYKNVKGELGSICKSNLDFFLMEGLDCWFVKSREDTLNFFIEQSKNESGYKQLMPLEKGTDIQLYQPYQRFGRKDVIMLVEIDHPKWPTLLKIDKKIINQ